MNVSGHKEAFPQAQSHPSVTHRTKGFCHNYPVFSSCGKRGTLHCGALTSQCGGLSCCGPQALGTWASGVAALGL